MLNIIDFILIAMAVASVSLTITKTYAFDWLREFLLENHALTLHKLFSCPFCLSHWFCLFLIFDRIDGSIVYKLICVFANITLTSLFIGLINFSMSFISD